jgi:hypothetical protein
MQRIGIHFFETCQLICKNMKFGSSSNQEVIFLETRLWFAKVYETWIETCWVVEHLKLK